ncbi:DNA-invertase hin [Roseimaritima multifibrata]|uniref:DNA-invertase hin n=1 Tax=Roseimaritima multifibrata TaxID=1930274 RepID=A0A517MAG8_9BACT|nr:recombinase family protein [Roseimaritima multifibrata]QDS91883.1 DNA-invertase hin [Roseimaritima multifibrata]
MAKLIAVYIRVSTTGQNEAGQRAVVQQWLNNHGHHADAVRWYVDQDTGDHLDRPGFKQLQQDVFSGTVGTVVVYKLDRLSRSMRDGIDTITDWAKAGIRLVSVGQQLDFSGTVGQMIAAVLLGVAQMEQELRRERQAAGIQVAKAQGKYKGTKPGHRKASPTKARRLSNKGLTQHEVAAAMGVSRATVARYLAATK